MQVFSTFDSNIYVEMALTQLEKNEIKRENIFAVPLDNRIEKRRVFDSIHRSDGISLIDIGVSLATAFSVVGVSVGLRMVWGPIIWGLISAFFGFVLGFFIKLIIVRAFHKGKYRLRGKNAEIILIIECEEEQGKMVEALLWEHFALGVAKVEPIQKDDPV